MEHEISRMSYDIIIITQFTRSLSHWHCFYLCWIQLPFLPTLF